MVDKNKDNMTIATHMFGLPGFFFFYGSFYIQPNGSSRAI